MGSHLRGLATKTDTHGHYQRIGEVYGFPISIISERTLGDGKENELKQLKSELAALDRKITTELAPKHDENDGTGAAFSGSTFRYLTIHNRQIRLQCLVCLLLLCEIEQLNANNQLHLSQSKV